MKVRTALLAASLGLTALLSCNYAGSETVVGSGVPVTEDYGFEGVRILEVHGPFLPVITRGKECRVRITADDNIRELIQVTQEGPVVRIGIASGRRPVNLQPKTALMAAIGLPELEGVTLTGAATGSVNGFQNTKSLQFRLQDASKLNGKLGADILSIEADGASVVTLGGKAREAHFRANGASRLELAELKVEQADVSLDGASTARLRVQQKLDYDLNGASHLEYEGRPALGRKEAEGASSVNPK